MKRQGLKTSIKELRQIADSLEKESKANCEKLGLEYKVEHFWQVNIINKKGLSDTWEFEK